MDENHQDKIESKTSATEAKISAPSEKKVGIAKSESKWPTTPAKWVELLGTPLTILVAIAGLLWGVYQFNAQQQSAQQQALDQQQQTTLEAYLDRMSDLLIPSDNKPGLHESKRGDEMRQVARARTLAALQNLNPVRKGILLQFLYESGLIYRSSSPNDSVNPILDMSGADLNGTDLRNADLNFADLAFANLIGANLSHAMLSSAELADSDLSDAHLDNAHLSDADLNNTDLDSADLTGARLDGAQLGCSSLRGTFLINVVVSNDTNLRGADLKGANLSGTNLSAAQLRSLGTTPDGTPRFSCGGI